MDTAMPNVAPIKSALFVDFDNIYIGLSKTDPQAAERFATDPARWLEWLERGLPAPAAENGVIRPRSILIRKCYPNPDAGFRRYRSFFTSAAFSVIDCPSMTRAGKNSADIYMVMDILDTLNHRTAFDEFIIFSGDSDFMPVLLRLRAHDRRTTSLAIDFMPPAFRAACDRVISEEDFIEDALGISHEGNCGGGMGRARVPVSTLKEMTMRLYDAVCADGEVAGADLPDILKDFRAFRESNNWLGFGTSQRLAEALICGEPRLHLVRLNPTMYKVSLTEPVVTTETVSAENLGRPQRAIVIGKHSGEKNGSEENGVPSEKDALSEHHKTHPIWQGSRYGERSISASQTHLRERIVAIVKELADSSQSPILLARASQYVVSKIGPQVLESQWGGMGSFKRLLQSVKDLGLEITTQPEPGYLFDPSRHPHPSTMRAKSETAEEQTDAAESLSSETSNSYAGDLEPQAATYGMDEHIGRYAADELDDDVDEEEDFEESLPTLEEFSRRVSQVTGAPHLLPKQYAIVFHGIHHELQLIAEGDKTYSTYQSSKAVSDWCAEQGEQIARSDVVQIFKGIIFQDGVRFGKNPGSYTALDLARVVRDNIEALCHRSRMELSDYEEHLLTEWLVSELEAEMLPAEDEKNNGDSQEAHPERD